MKLGTRMSLLNLLILTPPQDHDWELRASHAPIDTLEAISALRVRRYSAGLLSGVSRLMMTKSPLGGVPASPRSSTASIVEDVLIRQAQHEGERRWQR
jgi:hypothetical protein